MTDNRHIWNVGIADTDRDDFCLEVIRAHDAQEAAEKFACWYDTHGTSYDLAGCGLSIDVVVWQSPAISREGQAFTVTGHAVPKYTAQKRK